MSGYSALPSLATSLDARKASPFTLAKLYLYSSAAAILFLLATVHRLHATAAHKHSTVLNPYTCQPKSTFSSISDLCANSPQSPSHFDKLDLDLDRHLTSAQCDAVFPGLYKSATSHNWPPSTPSALFHAPPTHIRQRRPAKLENNNNTLHNRTDDAAFALREADRARDYYAARGGVNITDLDAADLKGQARAMIYNNRLYVKSYSNDQQGTRTKAALAAINQALLTSLEPVPDIEFVIQTGDTGMLAGAPWVLSRKAKEESLVLMPDYGFFSWPEPGVGSFLEVQDKTLDFESRQTWAQKIPKLFWRGALMIDLRKEFVDIASKYSWGAVSSLDWRELNGELLSPEEHCQYKFLGHVEGWAYSGRLKYLQQCRSVVVAHKMKYIQHFHHLFNDDPSSPDQNLVTIPGKGFELLPQTMQVLLDNDEWSERIANNSFQFYRHWLSPASVECYWRRLFERWAEVQNFTPVLTSDMTGFNSFILMGKAQWAPF